MLLERLRVDNRAFRAGSAAFNRSLVVIESFEMETVHYVSLPVSWVLPITQVHPLVIFLRSLLLLSCSAVILVGLQARLASHVQLSLQVPNEACLLGWTGPTVPHPR